MKFHSMVSRIQSLVALLMVAMVSFINLAASASHENENTAATRCGGTKQRYRVDVKTYWTERVTPRGFPSDPHFSDFVGVTHNSEYQMWDTGVKASDGLILLAEEGGTSVLFDEINSQGSQIVHASARGDYIPTGKGRSRFTVEADASQGQTLLSFASMIAPSPDWFIGIHDLDLCGKIHNKWRKKIVRKLYAYDAGSDGGLSFTSPNKSEDVNIFRLTGTKPNNPDSAFFGLSSPKSFARVTITRLD